MIKLTEGQTIKLNYQLEIESESGDVAIVEAGTPITIVNFVTNSPTQTPEEYYAEYGNYNVDIRVDDVPVINQWDRSGQSDYEVTTTTNIDIQESDLDLD